MLPNPANAKQILDRLQRERTAEAIFRGYRNLAGSQSGGRREANGGTGSNSWAGSCGKTGSKSRLKPEVLLPGGKQRG